MFSYGHPEMVIIEEKVNFNEILISKGTGMKDLPEDVDAVTYLIRNLIDDSFNLELGTYNHPKNYPGNDRPYVAINNKYFLNNENSSLFSFLPNEYKKNFRYKAHRSYFDNLKLQDTFTLVFGVDFHFTSPYLHYILTPEFSLKPKFVNLGFDQVLLIKSLKKIILSLPKTLLSRDFSNNDIMKFKPVIKIIYNEMYIVPEKINQLKGNHHLLQIYIRNQDDSSHNYDYKLENGTLQTSSLNKMLTTSFKKSELNNIKRDFGFGDTTLLGSIVINESTFYDYEKKITVEGFGDNSIIGEVIPYNFSGQFKRDIQMYLNSAFGKMNIRLFGNIAHPLLEVDEGIYRLETTMIDHHIKTQWKMNAENIIVLRKRFQTKPPHIISLRGLASLSEYLT